MQVNTGKCRKCDFSWKKNYISALNFQYEKNIKNSKMFPKNLKKMFQNDFCFFLIFRVLCMYLSCKHVSISKFSFG